MPVRLDGQKRPSAYFPGAAQEKSDTVDTPLGAMPFTTYFVQDDAADSGNRLYMMTVIDYEPGAFPRDSVDRRVAFFESTVAAAAEAVDGRAVISGPLDRGRWPAWTFRIDYGEDPGAIVRNEVYLVGERYYHLQVFAFAKDEGDKSRRRFFESFVPLPGR